MSRTAVAGTLWPDVDEQHANSSLRSAISRLEGCTRDAVAVTHDDLAMDDDVRVDLREARFLAHRLIAMEGCLEEGDLSLASVQTLSSDLLPDWYDDWVLLESERWRQLRLHALEHMSGRLCQGGICVLALEAAGHAVAAEPLRESARASLISVHFAMGNRMDAVAEFERYKAVLGDELGLEPTAGLFALIRQ